MARGARKAAVEAGPLEEPWELPGGWRWERLQDVAEINPTTELGAAGDEPVTFLGMAAVSEENGRVDVSVVRTASQVAKGFTRFRTGDVLFAKITPCMENGKMAVVPELASSVGAGSTEFHVVRSGKILPKLLFHFLVQRDVRQDARRNMSGTAGQMRVPADYLRLLPVPVPPMDVQRLLVKRIDELFAEIDEGEQGLEAAKVGVKTYRQSLLKAAVTGKLTAEWRLKNASKTGGELLEQLVQLRAAHGEGRRQSKGAEAAIANGPREGLPQLPDTWTWALLPQLGDFGRGKSKHRPRNDPRLYGGRYPFIQTGIVAASAGVIDEYEQTYSELGLQQSKLWPAGTVCITIAANIAMTGVLRFDACFPDSLVGLTCFDGVIPEYVELFVRTVQQELELYAPATAQKNINLETLYQLAVPLPPTAEQKAIVEIAHTDTGLDGLFDRHLDLAAAALRQSILAAAFRGDLVE